MRERFGEEGGKGIRSEGINKMEGKMEGVRALHANELSFQWICFRVLPGHSWAARMKLTPHRLDTSLDRRGERRQDNGARECDAAYDAAVLLITRELEAFGDGGEEKGPT